MTNKILVSACLLGQPVRYNGKAVAFKNSQLGAWQRKGWVVPLCPEIASGFLVPRPAAEIETSKKGYDVLRGSAKVLEDGGKDVTDIFVKGARIALEVAQSNGCKFALLTDGSPSCGSTFIYDGTFTGKHNSGAGVVATLLADNGIQVFAQQHIDLLADAITSQ